MTCRELVELVTAYFDDALPAPERERFDEHLESCPYCRVYLAQLRQVRHLLGQLSEDSIDTAARDALLERFADWKRG
jgi:anti-sigma factor RsiW